LGEPPTPTLSKRQHEPDYDEGHRRGVLKKKGLGAISRVPLSNNQRKEYMRDSSLVLRRGHFHRTIPEKQVGQTPTNSFVRRPPLRRGGCLLRSCDGQTQRQRSFRVSIGRREFDFVGHDQLMSQRDDLCLHCSLAAKPDKKGIQHHYYKVEHSRTRLTGHGLQLQQS
jgi:hypothetical protein